MEKVDPRVPIDQGVSIDEKYVQYWRRIAHNVSRGVVLILLGILLAGSFKGFSNTLWWTALLMITISFVYIFLYNIQTLHSVSVSGEDLEISVLQFSRMSYEISRPLKTVKVVVRRNYSSRYSRWQLQFFAGNKRIFVQEESVGWTYAKFTEIERRVVAAQIQSNRL